MIVLDCLSIAYYDHRDAKAASQEGKLGGGEGRRVMVYGGQPGVEVIYHGVS